MLYCNRYNLGSKFYTRAGMEKFYFGLPMCERAPDVVRLDSQLAVVVLRGDI